MSIKKIDSKQKQSDFTSIYISFWFLAIISLMFLLDSNGTGFLSLSAFFIHEFTHIFFIIIFGGTITSIKFSLGEMNIVTEKEFLTRGQNSIVSISAPLVNILIYYIFKEKCYEFAQINLVIAVFQLLPIISLDGDSFLENIKVPLNIRKIISFIFCLFFAIIGFCILIYSRYNFTLLFVSLYLIFITCKKD